jgi:hypothetical protein
MKHTLDHFASYFFAAALLVCACSARAQTVSPFMALGNAQFVDNNGNLLTSGVLYSYQAGTTTQQATYTDYTGLSQNPNPIPFGSGARASIWLTSTASYKFVLCSQNDGTSCAPSDVLFSVDHVPGCMGCSTGGNNFTGTFISGTPNPASTGILELASTDSLCWRNTANNANLCIFKDTSDILGWSGGVIKLPLGGCTALSAGYITLCASTAQNSFMMGVGGIYYQLPVVGTDITQNSQVNQLHFGTTATPLCTSLATGTIGWNGTNLCTMGAGSVVFGTTTIPLSVTAPTAGQVLKFDGTSIVGAPAGVQANSTTTLASPVSVPANTMTTYLTKAVTMPTSGCPCRVLASYGAYLGIGAAGVEVAWIFDGTNIFASSQSSVTGVASNFGLNGSAFSTVTYANSAVVTFTAVVETSASGGLTVAVNNNSGSPGTQPTWMNLAIFPSN